MVLVILLSLLYSAILIFVIVRRVRSQKEVIREFIRAQRSRAAFAFSKITGAIALLRFKRLSEELQREESVIHK
ncbi:hypothetical protein [Fulvivirga sedimenti]|uniref:Uncharacterized protein n=1 Tax=Fulvivirga sedimenti TaxID=2879465 RepID=A0A9X1HU12_9BACT|nr:hypothetical protein [Fulvivirga sedimenti]MCA6077925.1 hypothetical protein [Fulvivirga sedimenti]